ncbi:hypothetical protein JOB18_024286 [Solea senegalensis]|uniref:Uncharacterized protein n=1 Tax=Solea senegalensis TaxID=28829 RepID=A0AAV6S485_SOLSE|nr:hypothetical protein JOB18_024286 [Solea senegalensis]
MNQLNAAIFCIHHQDPSSSRNKLVFQTLTRQRSRFPSFPLTNVTIQLILNTRTSMFFLQAHPITIIIIIINVHRPMSKVCLRVVPWWTGWLIGACVRGELRPSCTAFDFSGEECSIT